MALPPIPGFNVITKSDGTQVYSRYTQADYLERNSPSLTPAVPTPQATANQKVIQGPKTPVISFGKPVSGTAQQPPPPKPTQEISSNTYQLVEVRRKAAGETPLGTVETVKIVSPTHSGPPPENKIVTPPLQNKQTYTQPTPPPQPVKEVNTTQTTYVRKNDNPLLTGLASLVEVPAYIGFSFGALAANLTGKETLGIKPGTPKSQEQQVQEKIQKSLGITPLDVLSSGDVKSFSEMSLPEKVAGLGGSALGIYLSGGGNLKKDIGGLISKFVKSTPKEVPLVSEKITASFVRQTPTYRATNPMREKVPTDVFSFDNAESPLGSAKPNEPSNPLLENVSVETQKTLSKVQNNLLIPAKEKPVPPNQPVKEDKTYKPSLEEFRTMGKKINTDQVLNIEQPQIGDTPKFTKELKKNPNVNPNSPNLGEVPLIAERYPLMSNEPFKIPEKTLSQENINLGKGIGQMINKEGGKNPLDITKPSKPPGTPPPTETKTKGGQVLLLEKPLEEKPTLEPPKQQTKSTFKEYPIMLGEGKGEQVKAVPKAELLTKQETKPQLQTLTKQKQDMLKSFQSSKQLQAFSSLTSQKQKQSSKFKSLQKQEQPQLFKQKQTQPQKFKSIQKQEQPQLLKQTQKTNTPFPTPQKQKTPFPTPQKQKTNTPFPTPQKTKQTQKIETLEKPPKKPPLLINGPSTPKEPHRHKHKGKKKKGFIGNAPISALVGIYAKEGEITYNKRKITKLTHRSLSASKKNKPETGFSIAKKLGLG